MRCHFHTDSDGKRHLIPGCWGVVHNMHLTDTEALKFCHCPPKNKKDTEQGLRELKQKMKELEARLKKLEQKPE